MVMPSMIWGSTTPICRVDDVDGIFKKEKGGKWIRDHPLTQDWRRGETATGPMIMWALTALHGQGHGFTILSFFSCARPFASLATLFSLRFFLGEIGIQH